MNAHLSRLMLCLTIVLLIGFLCLPVTAAGTIAEPMLPLASPPTADMSVIYAVAALLIVAIVILIFREPRAK